MGIATPLSTSGRFIVDANGRRVKLAGANWFGAHEDDGIAPGLDRVHRGALADTIAGLGFNCGNMHAWLTTNDIDWCWWGLNATHAKGTNPATGRPHFSWGDRATDGLLAEDWRSVASPAIMEILQSMIPARTGPGSAGRSNG